ncbi:MAG: DNA polymerase [Candidatus Paceibacteria bacterium]
MAKTKDKSKRLVLLDAHAILHRAYHALPDFTAPGGEPTGALYGVVTMTLKIIEEFTPEYIIACFDLPEPTYRHDAYADYKGKRTKTDDALVAQIQRSYDLFKAFGIPVLSVPGFEADDILGTLAAATREHSNLEVVIASGDMDTLQCVDKKRVRVYTLKKGIKDTIIYDEATVKERFGFPPTLVPDYKGLRGDASDNIPGIAGIGEKTATQLITQFGSIDNIYKKLKKDETQFLEKGIKPRIVGLLKENEEEAQFSKMIATIRTDAPVTFVPEDALWRTTAKPEDILALFSELGFRSLGARITTLFSIEPEVVAEADNASATPEAVQRTGVLLWLIESERTNSTYEDIVDYGRAYLETSDFVVITKKLEEQVKAISSLWKVFEKIEMPLLTILPQVSAYGITLDTKYLEQLSKIMHKELSVLEARIYKVVGHEFNLNSPKQLGVVLFEDLGLKPKNQKKTAGGQLSTKESELEKMRDDHEIIVDILRYRELQKLTSTYIDAFPKLVSPDGRLRTTFLQTGTTTGRIASRDPNLQNIPIRTKESKAIRGAFVAGPGYSLVSIDYSQIELRIAAILSRDESLTEIFRKGEDVHTGVAVRVFGVTESEVTSEMRRKAKVINFGILYGMGVNALRSNLGEGTPREEAQAFLNAYFNTFTRLAEYLEETKHTATKLGYTETLFGRRRYFPGLRSHQPFIKAQAERMAINAPVQGTAADVMRIAMIEVYEYLKRNHLTESVKMVLQVHDELVFEIKSELVGKEVSAIEKIMEGVLLKYDTGGVPLKVDTAVGINWGEL